MKTLDLIFDAGNTSDIITLKDGHRYTVHRSVCKRNGGPDGFAYALLNCDDGQWNTPYMSDAAMDILLYRREGR